MSDPRYPVGQFQMTNEKLSDDERAQFIAILADAPARLRAAVAGLDEAQLATPYREGGWTLRQTVHHVADSHMNGYIRVKLALTEDAPQIKTYDEKDWANLSDTQATPVETSLKLVEALHDRWATLFRTLTPAQRARFVKDRG